VGSFAVQLAARCGATVVATAKAGEDERYIRSLGVTETVDYSAGDVVEAVRGRFPDGIDSLIDVVDRDDVFAAVAALVRAGGHIATTISAADVEGLAARGIRATNVTGIPTTDKLTALAGQVAAGTLQVAAQAYPLTETVAALAGFTAGTRGKIVPDIGEAGQE
jgi:NADPH:quinone reductase-like Zn-dependent oxidoreductase